MDHVNRDPAAPGAVTQEQNMDTLNLFQAQSLAMLGTSDISKVYSGRPSASGNHCRCGCRGTYRYSSDVDILKERGYAGDASDVSDRQVARVLALVQVNASIATSTEDMAWFDVELPTGRSYTIYLKAARS